MEGIRDPISGAIQAIRKGPKWGCQIEGTRYGSIAGLFLHHLRNPEML